MAWPRSRLSPCTCSKRCSDSARVRSNSSPYRGRQDDVAVDDLADFIGRRDEIGGRIGEQRGQGPQRLHHTTSIRVLALSLPPANRLPPLSPEAQPLPKLKPQA